MNPSKTQIDKLGERLKKGPLSEEDIKSLDEYRRSFNETYETVVQTIHDRTRLEPTGRPAKSTSSIKEKLLRESIRLTQIQDIAGCRIVVADIVEQEAVIRLLSEAFPKGSISKIDRREAPSHGYRAVHIIVELSGKLVEIQIRTALQHLWAEFSEKLSDVFDPKIKYGGGNDDVQKMLMELSEFVKDQEERERIIAALQSIDLDKDSKLTLQKLNEEVNESRGKMANHFNSLISKVNKINR